MLEKYFCAPKTLARLRSGLSGPYIDSFADALERDGYSLPSAVRYLRAAVHFGRFLQRRSGSFPDVRPDTLDAFSRHLPLCHCPLLRGGKDHYHTRFGAKRFHAYLVQTGICQPCCSPGTESPEPELIVSFRDWFRQHRGAAECTLRQYARGAAALIDALGANPSRWKAVQVREFMLDRSRHCGAGTTQKLITSLRAFLRYLRFRGLCSTDLDQAVPAFAHWRLASLPRCLSAKEVNRLIAACSGSSPRQLRDRAIILMLVRLGLRAGDVSQLRLSDIDWQCGTLRVLGKGRHEVRLPLPQDVGEAILSYLEYRIPAHSSPYVFLRHIAPFKPFLSADSVSSVVKRALQRAGIQAPAKGAHLLRHTAATEMLRHGVPLHQIGLVLRHRSLDMTAYYAKVDVALLQRVAQPWPEVNP
ncbi:MAG TPA: site-specific integrase [Terriglobia bacterium]|nr:site-specific integrase [Terriglobia bacterium]